MNSSALWMITFHDRCATSGTIFSVVVGLMFQYRSASCGFTSWR
jgi:hypothetical protein